MCQNFVSREYVKVVQQNNELKIQEHEKLLYNTNELQFNVLYEIHYKLMTNTKIHNKLLFHANAIQF